MTQGSTDLQGGLLHGTGTVGGPLRNAANVQGDGAGGITLTGAVSGPGGYKGSVTFAGSFTPGDPVLITGENMIFASTNTLFMDIGGTVRGSDYDAIDALDFTLSGTLMESLINDFIPVAGDYFDIMDAPGFLGDFSTLDLPALSAGLSWEAMITELGSGEEAYRLEVVNQTVPTPESSSAIMLALGLGTLFLMRNRFKTAEFRHIASPGRRAVNRLRREFAFGDRFDT